MFHNSKKIKDEYCLSEFLQEDERLYVAECMEIQAEIMRDSMPEDARYFNPWTGFHEKALKDLPLKQKELTQVYKGVYLTGRGDQKRKATILKQMRKHLMEVPTLPNFRPQYQEIRILRERRIRIPRKCRS